MRTKSESLSEDDALNGMFVARLKDDPFVANLTRLEMLYDLLSVQPVQCQVTRGYLAGLT